MLHISPMKPPSEAKPSKLLAMYKIFGLQVPFI